MDSSVMNRDTQFQSTILLKLGIHIRRKRLPFQFSSPILDVNSREFLFPFLFQLLIFILNIPWKVPIPIQVQEILTNKYKVWEWMIRAVLLHTLLLCLSLRSDLSLSFPTPSMAKRKSCCTLHYLVTRAAILHFKQTDCFILHDVKTIENELKAGNIKLQPASVLYVDLGQLGWWPYTEHHPKMGFFNYFQAYFLQ